MGGIPRYYVDTSVFGGCEDEEFMDESVALFKRAHSGHLILLISPILLREIANAPPSVQRILPGLPATALEAVPLEQEATELRDAYLEAGVVGARWMDDAHHVAMATVSRADLIVSWNFKHLVNINRIRGFNSVNLRMGYSTIDIRSPKEVMTDEDQDV